MIPLSKTSLSQTKPLFLFNGIYLWCHSDVRNRGDETAAIPVYANFTEVDTNENVTSTKCRRLDWTAKPQKKVASF